MSQNRLNWVGNDLTSVPAKFGDPGTSRTVTKEVYWSGVDVFMKMARKWHESQKIARKWHETAIGQFIVPKRLVMMSDR